MYEVIHGALLTKAGGILLVSEWGWALGNHYLQNNLTQNRTWVVSCERRGRGDSNSALID